MNRLKSAALGLALAFCATGALAAEAADCCKDKAPCCDKMKDKDGKMACCDKHASADKPKPDAPKPAPEHQHQH